MTAAHRKWGYAVLAIAALAAGVWWIGSYDATRAVIANAVGGKPAQTAAKAKPICATPVNPNVAAPVDCIPAQFANLPPDPGEAGKLTIDGIDADKDGMRDDVQRWIALEWGHSPIAVKALTTMTGLYLRAVHYGDSLGKEETRKRFTADLARQGACVAHLETQEMLEKAAYERALAIVRNTPERFSRAESFDYMFANSAIPAFDGTEFEACGFSVAALAAAEGKQTVHSIYRAERLQRMKLEQQEEADRDAAISRPEEKK